MSQSKISLVLFNASSKPSWDLGDVLLLDYSVESLFQNQEKIRALTADYLLFWDANIALPSSKDLQSAYSSPGNLWHIGTKLGLSGHPKILDYVQPTNMFHVECDDHIDHSSWKMTFRGCLMKARVFNLIDID